MTSLASAADSSSYFGSIGQHGNPALFSDVKRRMAGELSYAFLYRAERMLPQGRRATQHIAHRSIVERLGARPPAFGTIRRARASSTAAWSREADQELRTVELRAHADALRPEKHRSQVLAALSEALVSGTIDPEGRDRPDSSGPQKAGPGNCHPELLYPLCRLGVSHNLYYVKWTIHTRT